MHPSDDDGRPPAAGSAEARSQLLQADLPPGLGPLLHREGFDPPRAFLRTHTDLNLEGGYEPVYLLVEPDRLYVAAAPNERWKSAARMVLQRADVREVRTRQGVGGGFLEALVEGVYVEILAYSNTRSETFHKVEQKLKAWLAAAPVEIGPEDDEDPRRCAQCGMPLDFKGDTCRRCVNRGAVLVRVFHMMRPYRKRAAIMMSLVLVGIGVALVPQQLVRLLINKVLAPEQAGNPPLDETVAVYWLLGLVGSLFGTYLIGALINGTTARLASFVGTQITFDMRSRVFHHLTRLGVAFYDRYSVGQLMARVSSDTEHMKAFVQQLTSGFLAQLITVAAVGAVLFALSWKLAFFTLLPAPLVMLSAVFFWKRVYPRYYRVSDAVSKLQSRLNTVLSGVRVVKAFGQEQREQTRFGQSSGYVRDSYRNVEYTVAMFNPAMGLLFQMGGLIVWFVGGRQVLYEGMPLGDLIAFLGLLGMFYQPLGHLTQLTTWLTQFLTATQRTFEILDTSPQILQTQAPQALPAKPGAVRFENVTFGYNRREPILKGISFAVEAGEHVGVVGKSGSGKTTLINLLARFYDVDDGCVRIDGIDVRDLSEDDIRRAVGIVLQEPFLFRGTIRANIAYGRTDATLEQIIAAAKSANAHDFIMRHPLGYDTYIGERGAGLSGGERQRVSIARALLYDPPILILDEATSNVDTESEQLIQAALQRVTEGRTTLAIAHRLSTLRHCDRILVIDGGHLVEQGSHQELLDQQGLYYRLVKIQTDLSREPSVDALTVNKP